MPRIQQSNVNVQSNTPRFLHYYVVLVLIYVYKYTCLLKVMLKMLKT